MKDTIRLMVAEFFLKLALAIAPQGHPHTAELTKALHAYLSAVLADK